MTINDDSYRAIPKMVATLKPTDVRFELQENEPFSAKKPSALPGTLTQTARLGAAFAPCAVTSRSSVLQFSGRAHCGMSHHIEVTWAALELFVVAERRGLRTHCPTTAQQQASGTPEPLHFHHLLSLLPLLWAASGAATDSSCGRKDLAARIS